MKLGPFELNKIHQGDCLELMKKLPDGCADALATDPPYFQPATHYCPTRKGGIPKKILADMSILKHFFKSFIMEAARIIRPDGTFYIFCDGQSYSLSFMGLFPYCKHVRPLIWDKITSFNGYTWRHQHELIAWGERDKSPRIPTGDGDVLRHRAVRVKERLHPAEKPNELLTRLINKTKEGGIVLDCFAGSGTAGIASMKTGRQFIGFELDSEYCNLANHRIEAMKNGLSLNEHKQEQKVFFHQEPK